MILVFFTTNYRDGGAQFERVARTLGEERGQRVISADGQTPSVKVIEVNSKRAWIEMMISYSAASPISELHFVGHGGIYGPMLGTTSWPEQLSPYEWRTLVDPERGTGRVQLARGAEVFIHTCRSARWFAPFLARTWGVTCWGNHWYTTFSGAPDRFVHPWRVGSEAPLHLFGCPGMTSHGWTASVHKHVFGGAPESMRAFMPEATRGGETYDAVAPAYDQTFGDIGVRRGEVRWIESRIDSAGRPPRLLEIGCGTGGLLDRLAPRIESGLGVDSSAAMVSLAERRLRAHPHISVAQIDGPALSLPNDSVDCVVSMLSWRYLDWEPMLKEIARVLTDDGTLLVVDMVEKTARVSEFPRLLVDHLKAQVAALRAPEYRRARADMVRSEAWSRLVAYNPMRALHEYEWFFRSRFPEVEVETIAVGRRARVMAYDCGAMSKAELTPLCYP